MQHLADRVVVCMCACEGKKIMLQQLATTVVVTYTIYIAKSTEKYIAYLTIVCLCTTEQFKAIRRSFAIVLSYSLAFG